MKAGIIQQDPALIKKAIMQSREDFESQNQKEIDEALKISAQQFEVDQDLQ